MLHLCTYIIFDDFELTFRANGDDVLAEKEIFLSKNKSKIKFKIIANFDENIGRMYFVYLLTRYLVEMKTQPF